MTTVAVIAHTGKTFGGGLTELRRILADNGYDEPLWYEVTKSRQAPAQARRAIADGADLLFIWGGDGTVQRCADAVAGQAVNVAILPAGTANLFATNLKIPKTLSAAVDVGLNGDRRQVDLGVLNDERFAVMAGVGFDAIMMRDADRTLKGRLGRLAYVWTAVRATKVKGRKVRVDVDGERWFKGQATCVLLGQMGTLGAGITAFPDAKPDDGLLEIGVVTATNVVEWTRVLSRLVVRNANQSPFVEMGRGERVDIQFDRTTTYELDGGARKAKKKFRASVDAGALTVCVPKVTST